MNGEVSKRIRGCISFQKRQDRFEGLQIVSLNHKPSPSLFLKEAEPDMCHSLKKPLLSFDHLTPSCPLLGYSQALKAISGQLIAGPFFVGLLSRHSECLFAHAPTHHRLPISHGWYSSPNRQGSSRPSKYPNHPAVRAAGPEPHSGRDGEGESSEFGDWNWE